ncbi:hypothetical protein [Aquimarina aquimarini]|uniref:hypothetical protein n=1 Tax=Aquimarina aquimarini TaxID=1191734 RepID=UPI000D55B544|nr:hypothetical protein [Aquimarina aquimarini]
MRKIVLYFIGILLISSCVTNKEVLRPYVKFEIYDSITKKPVDNVTLSSTINDSSQELNDQNMFSDKKGIIIIPKSEVSLGDHKKIMLLTTIKYVFKKQGCEKFILDLHSHLKIKSSNDLKERYKTKIFLERSK